VDGVVELSWNVTVPVGAPGPIEATVAERAIETPAVDGLAEADSVVVVGDSGVGSTMRFTDPEVLFAKSLAPP